MLFHHTRGNGSDITSEDVHAGQALNEFGVFVSRVCGPVMMFHTLGMAWEFVRALEVKKELADALAKMERRAIDAEARLADVEAKLAEAEAKLVACGCGA